VRLADINFLAAPGGAPAPTPEGLPPPEARVPFQPLAGGGGPIYVAD
jgi:hypothetical protein